MLTPRRARLLSIALAFAFLLGACGSAGDDRQVGAGSTSDPTDLADEPPGDANPSDAATRPADGEAPPVAGICAVDAPDCADTVDPDDPAYSPIRDGDEPGLEPTYEVVQPRGDAANTRPQSWERWEPANGEGTVLRIFFTGGVEPCFVVDRVDVVETADTVTLTLVTGSDKAAGDTACIEIAKFYAVDVELAAPFGDRDVVDGAA